MHEDLTALNGRGDAKRCKEAVNPFRPRANDTNGQ
jgi:hypothetical protein